jgi:trehalose 6-phosphate synthase/phosphatase
MRRLLIAANRLPVTAEPDGDAVRLTLSGGGLATGMRGVYASGGSALWVGWPGEIEGISEKARRSLDADLAKKGLVPVHLSREEVHGFYEDISNTVLWPVYHMQIDQIPFEVRGWDAFVSANERFAETIAREYRAGDLIWVQDYQLSLVPAMLRERLPNAAIGFFLHIPFPPSDAFRVVPWRVEILEGMLGADLVGFHTPTYLRHFGTSLQRILGLQTQVDRVRYGDRDIRMGVFPMGIDAQGWSTRAADAGVLADVAELRREAGHRKLLVGVDRLDHTKGLERRCLAVEHLLASSPAARDAIRFVQVTVPSREGVEAYAELRKRLDELIGRINAEFATPSAVPIHHIHRSISEHELSTLYRAADVMLVTPVRDGMNLVAKEFVASRPDGDGVLVLSEFAGAAWELGEAVQVNPYDIEGVALSLQSSLDMPEAERRARMRALRSRVFEHDVHTWAESFIDALEVANARAREATGAPSASGFERLKTIFSRLPAGREMVLFLDYDGTLVPFAATPEQAAPDPELLTLLAKLAARPGCHVHLVSGRTRASLDEWFGSLPIGLHAEHGLWTRPPCGTWTMTRQVRNDWKEQVRPTLDQFTSTTRGAFVEEKTAGLAWHYRAAEADSLDGASFGDTQAQELRLLLSELLSNSPVEVLSGDKVIEVRPHGVDKGSIAARLLARGPCPDLVIAFGDDQTDEDLFGALPAGAISVHVGGGASAALYRVDSVADVRKLLSIFA